MFLIYSFITNKVTKTFNMVLQGGIKNFSRYFIKIYWYFVYTFQQLSSEEIYVYSRKLVTGKYKPKYYVLLKYWFKLLILPCNTMSFFVFYMGNSPLKFYFDLKIAIVLLKFIKSLSGLYILNTAFTNSIRFTISQNLSIGFTNIFSSMVKNI